MKKIQNSISFIYQCTPKNVKTETSVKKIRMKKCQESMVRTKHMTQNNDGLMFEWYMLRHLHCLIIQNT